MTFIRIAFACAVLGVLSFSASLHAQSTEADIKERLAGRPLYLRGFWGSDDLSFDAAGNLTSKSPAVSFTLSGFEFSYAHLKRGRIEIGGQRVVIEFAKDTPKRVKINSEIHLQIALPPDGDLGPALDKLFTDGLPALAPILPSYWQVFAHCHLTEPASAANCSVHSDKSPGQQVDRGVTRPRVTKEADAYFNGYARQLYYSGISTVHFAVTRDGLPTAISIVHPLGVGLDEQAIASLARYSFSPAIKNGEPIESELDIDVEFKIF